MRMTSRIASHHAVSCALLGIYGTQVCPFIDTLSFAQLVTPILITFLGLHGCRRTLQIWLNSKTASEKIKSQFKIDLFLFIIAGVALATYNSAVHQFPFESGLKVVFGMAVLGFYIACDLGLRYEHSLALELQKSGRHLEIDQFPYPLTKKFCWFASICAVVLAVVVSLVLAKDLVWLTQQTDGKSLHTAALHVSLEVAFVLLVILAYILSIISAHGSNLALFLDSQKKVLNKVAEGELGARVPIASNDEFGVIASHTNLTIETLEVRTEELAQMRDVTILALASLAETRDNETGAHILRTQQYVKVLAEHLKDHPRFSAVLTEPMIDLLYKSAPLHDAGKVGIPDAILLKPGKLTDEEYSIMKQHPSIGSMALRSAQSVLGENSFLSVACEIMDTHHEKWDGSGYPNGLKAYEIPISGRLMALADVYDALISERVYKAAFTHEEAKAIIIDGRGSHFDPDVVDAFLEIEATFVRIAEEFAKPSLALKSAA